MQIEFIDKKILVSAKVLYEFSVKNFSEEDSKQFLKKHLGIGWSLTSAAQYLTGKSATDTIMSLASDFEYEGLTKKEFLAVMISAHDFCANASLNGPISAGRFVDSFKI